MLWKKILLVSFSLIGISNSFNLTPKPVPVHSFYRHFEVENKKLPSRKKLLPIKVNQPFYSDKKNTSGIIFFTGGSSFIISDIYQDFINQLVNHNLVVYTPFWKYSDHSNLIDQLRQDHTSVIVMGHSSGATPAINFCKDNSLVRKLILLDGVNTGYFIGQTKFNLKYIDHVLMINAGKSYQWNYDPWGPPFIPFFEFHPQHLEIRNKKNIKTINLNEYGHSDILDIPYANFMHQIRISVGHKNRSTLVNRQYHQLLARLISSFRYNCFNYCSNNKMLF